MSPDDVGCAHSAVPAEYQMPDDYLRLGRDCVTNPLGPPHVHRQEAEPGMRRLALVAVVVASTLVAACGGSTKTVTATTPTQSSNGGGATGQKASAVAACFAAGGAAVVGPTPAGQGTSVHALTRDSAYIGYLEGANPAEALIIAHVFRKKAHWKIEPIKNNPQGFAGYKGTLTSADAALLSKCTK